MDATSLFEYQEEVNKQIYINSNLNQYKIAARRSLELHIKLSSLADETQCFKYWVDNEDCSICHNTVSKKYLNCLSQIISIGIDRNYADVSEVRVVPNDYCLSDQFLNLFVDVNDLLTSPSKDHYLTLLEDFLSLGITLGYSQNQIKNNFMNNS